MICQTKHVADELISILERLVVIYQELNVLGNDKKKSLDANNLTFLQEIVRREEELASLVEIVEESRLTLQKKVLDSPVTFGQLIALLDESSKAHVTLLTQELKQLVEELRLKTETNSIITQHLSNLSRHKMNILLGVSTMPTYENNSSNTIYSRNKGLIDKNI
ncbi:flagellar export chaperone FlgN [Pelosinus sp. IPA-1]|uniref:flagellar export chaperone FlgN n=1 Tax=Pelosinus sp. IPA-1 TaxID=3029569 RepID=UPI00243616BD|nr:flagellar export chaperone FlgN [Pelosinus sp. IPA-1]GMB01687.1 hypothetical protein PIPA1_44870 [Pelosinus sp. IPA-1]